MSATTLSPVPAWLREFCSKDDTVRTTLTKPFPIEYNGAPAVAATNGHILAVVPGAFDIATPEAPTSGTIPAIVRDALSRDTRRVRLDTLRDYCGTKPLGWPCPDCAGAGVVECPECYGTGETQHECSCGHLHEAECEACDEGKARCTTCRGGKPKAFDVTPVDLAGVHFNRDLLGDVVRALPGDGPVTWHVGGYGATGSGHAAALVGDDWIALVMPITRRDTPPMFEAWEAES